MKTVFYFILTLLLFVNCKTQLAQDTKTIIAETVETKARPNVILIMADDMGYETLNINGGNSYRTPNLDRMALSGMRFNHCYSQPLCTPSRVKIMTGISNVRNYVKFGVLDTNQITFGNLFEDAGYATCVVGKWQLGKDPKGPQKFGFQEHCLWQLTEGRIDTVTGNDTRFSEPLLDTNGDLKRHSREEYGPKVVSDYGMDFIDRSAKVNKPFLLYYPMILTHCPFSPTLDSKSWMTSDSSIAIYKGHPVYFEDMMSYADKIVGNINSKLEELGIAENTLVIFTGDNGTDKPIVSYMYGREVVGAKGTSPNAGTRVPLIAKWPGKIKAGTTTDELVDFSEMLPTICEAAAVPLPATPQLDGQSFLPLLKGESYEPRQWIYNWYSRFGITEKASVFARTQQYKLYNDGRFYEIPDDYLEEKPIPKTDLNSETLATYKMLEEVIADYGKRRQENIKDKKPGSYVPSR